MICNWYLIDEPFTYMHQLSGKEQEVADEQELSSRDTKAQIGGALEELVEPISSLSPSARC